MATLRNKRKLAAVASETAVNTRISQSQNTLDPKMTQEYIFQVSEEIQGRVTKKFSKHFSQTESRFLGALSKLDEFLLNPQVRTCSVAVTVTIMNNDSGNREPNGDCSPNDPCAETKNSSHQCENLNSSELEEYPHMVTGGSEEILLSPSHGNTNSRRDSVLLAWDLVKKTKESKLHKSATISHLEHSCDN